MGINEITSEQGFKDAIETGVSLVDFNAPWCGPCRSQEPILVSFSEKMKDQAKVFAINIDNHQGIAMKFGIQSIPTLIFFKNGKEIQRFVGLQNEQALMGAFEKI